MAGKVSLSKGHFITSSTINHKTGINLKGEGMCLVLSRGQQLPPTLLSTCGAGGAAAWVFHSQIQDLQIHGNATVTGGVGLKVQKCDSVVLRNVLSTSSRMLCG